MEIRSVLYRELDDEFNPDGWSQDTEAAMEEQEGSFHTWIVEEEKSPHSESEVYVPVTKALIEKKDGTMVAVKYSNVRFIKK